MIEQEKQKYLKSPNHCPKCGSENINSGTIEADGSSAWSNVTCEDCNAVWKDIYKLTDIEIIGE